jgi:hypothetical protein
MQERPLTGKQRKAIVKNVEVEEVNSDNCFRGNNNMNTDNEVDCISGMMNKKILQSEHIDSRGTKPATTSLCLYKS